MSASHLEESLRRDIELIRSKVVEMAGLCERALKGGLQALLERNGQLAYSVILRDQYIDELENELDRLCLEFLIRQQPVAGHLRFVFATIKMNKGLERVGDYAESIARQVLLIAAMEPPPSYTKFVEIANLSIPMLHDAVQAFVDRNADLAKATLAVEDKVDQLRNSLDAELMRLRAAGKLPLEALAPLLTIARRFERVADQARNICEEVLYMCTGQFVRHTGAEVFRVVFLDEHNSCRSQMAEGIGEALGAKRFVFSSGGIVPSPVDQQTVRFLADKGIDISRHVSKSFRQIPNLEHYQVIVALAKEAQTVFPTPPTKRVCLVWQIDDPSKFQGSPEEVRAAYETTFRFLDGHIRALVGAVLGGEGKKEG